MAEERLSKEPICYSKHFQIGIQNVKKGERIKKEQGKGLFFIEQIYDRDKANHLIMFQFYLLYARQNTSTIFTNVIVYNKISTLVNY